MIAPTWSAERTRRRIALAQADSWADEWQRISHKVPRASRSQHPTFKVFRFWVSEIPYLRMAAQRQPA